MTIERITSIFDDLETCYEKDLIKFEEYQDIPRINELKKLIIHFRQNNLLIEFEKTGSYVINPKNYTIPKNLSKNMNPLIKIAKKELKNPKIPLKFFKRNYYIDYLNFDALLMLLEFNYCYYSQKNEILENITKFVFEGNIIIYLSQYIEDFKKNNEIKEYSPDFFKKLSKIKFRNKKSEKLDDFIRGGYLCNIIIEQKIPKTFYNNIIFSANYLMGCSAIRNNHKGITCEDVVIGYVTTLKLLTEDIRHYIDKYYEEVI